MGPFQSKRRMVLIVEDDPDIRLSGLMDGIGLAREVKMRWPHLVVLLTSGNAGEHLDLPPGVEYIAKPWQLADVLTAAERARSSPGGR